MLVANRLLRYAGTGGTIVVCAPSLRPQAALSLARTAERFRRMAAHPVPRVRFEGDSVHCGAASAVFLSGMEGANVAGHTASLLLIGDEAQDLDKDWFNRQFKPMTASTGASTVLFGTPWQGGSLLEETVERNRARDAKYSQFPSPYRNGWHAWHHQVSWQEVGKFNPEYLRYVEQERERLGPHHPIFLSQYELVSVADEHRLLGPSLLWALEGKFDGLAAPFDGERYVGGLDFAGEGTAAMPPSSRWAGWRTARAKWCTSSPGKAPRSMPSPAK
jgi:hypothetical protein